MFKFPLPCHTLILVSWFPEAKRGSKMYFQRTAKQPQLINNHQVWIIPSLYKMKHPLETIVCKNLDVGSAFFLVLDMRGMGLISGHHVLIISVTSPFCLMLATSPDGGKKNRFYQLPSNHHWFMIYPLFKWFEDVSRMHCNPQIHVEYTNLSTIFNYIICVILDPSRTLMITAPANQHRPCQIGFGKFVELVQWNQKRLYSPAHKLYPLVNGFISIRSP